jgi:16S rRNA (guanine966-N2)-methyltransferase
MRIIAGERRGRRIEGPGDEGTRPTSDLVREAIFNILADRVADAHVYDLFAGSGALGLEALSRGASRATFIEINRDNVGLIRRNVDALGYADACKVSLADAHRFGRAFQPEGNAPIVVFLDPPYVEYQRHSDKISNLIAGLADKAPEGSTIVVESGKHWDEALLPDLDRWDIRRYGGTVVAFRFLDSQTEGETEGETEDEAENTPASEEGDDDISADHASA